MSDNDRLASRSAPLAQVHLASKNPSVAHSSYFDKMKETKRHKSAPLENKVFTNYCVVIDHDDLKNKGMHKALGSLEKNYTRGVRQNESKRNGAGEDHSIEKGGSHTNGLSQGRPWSPTPGVGRQSSLTLDTPDQSTKPVRKEGTNGANPREWTKQRTHENNMEWRSGYEVRFSFEFRYLNMASSSIIDHISQPYCDLI